MAGPEQRVVIEDLQRYEQTLRSTAVRRGDESVWVSTVRILPLNPEVGVIETATSRIKGVKADGREGKEKPYDTSKLVPLMPFFNQFPLSEVQKALEFHARIVDRVASILEENPELFREIEEEQLRD